MSLGYMPSFTDEKKRVSLRVVSVAVLSFPRERTSMQLPLFCRGSRKGSASMYPVVGKLSSNIIISRISSVSASLSVICAGSSENSSLSTLSAA